MELNSFVYKKPQKFTIIWPPQKYEAHEKYNHSVPDLATRYDPQICRSCIHVLVLVFICVYRKSLRTSYFLGFGNGFTDGMFYCLYAAVFRFGTFLINLDEDHFLHQEYDEIYTWAVVKWLWYSFTLILAYLNLIQCILWHTFWNRIGVPRKCLCTKLC